MEDLRTMIALAAKRDPEAWSGARWCSATWDCGKCSWHIRDDGFGAKVCDLWFKLLGTEKGRDSMAELLTEMEMEDVLRG